MDWWKIYKIIIRLLKKACGNVWVAKSRKETIEWQRIPCKKMLQTQWEICSAEMWQIHKWSIDGLGIFNTKNYKISLRKKEWDFLLRIEIWNAFLKKKKTCENAVFTQVLELIVGLEPTACALRMRCSTNWAISAFIQFFTCFEPESANSLPFTNALLYQLSHISIDYCNRNFQIALAIIQ